MENLAPGPQLSRLRVRARVASLRRLSLSCKLALSGLRFKLEQKKDCKNPSRWLKSALAEAEQLGPQWQEGGGGGGGPGQQEGDWGWVWVLVACPAPVESPVCRVARPAAAPYSVQVSVRAALPGSAQSPWQQREVA